MQKVVFGNKRNQNLFLYVGDSSEGCVWEAEQIQNIIEGLKPKLRPMELDWEQEAYPK